MCIKYKIMAVQPLNKTKIIKKKTNKIRRFQSDEFYRVKVRLEPADPLGNSRRVVVGPREAIPLAATTL